MHRHLKKSRTDTEKTGFGINGRHSSFFGHRFEDMQTCFALQIMYCVRQFIFCLC